MRKLYALLLINFLLLLSTNRLSAQAPVITNESEPNNTSATAQVLNLAAQNVTIVNGSISPAADVDFYRIDGVVAGSKIWGYVDPGGTQNPGANSRDPQLRIFAADGTTLIEFDDDDGTGNGGDGTTETGFASSIAGRTLTAGGTYYIHVQGFSGTNIIDPYKLFVIVTAPGAGSAEAEPNGTAATANTIVTGTGVNSVGIRTGQISSSGEVDFYSVVAQAGHIIYMSMDGDPSRSGVNTLDGVVSVIAPDGTTVLLSGDSGFGGANNSEGFSWNVLVSGTYYIRVAGFSTESGRDYALMVASAQASVPPPPPCSGVPSPGAITPATSTVCAGAPVTLTLSGFTTGSGISFQWKSSPTTGGPYTNIAGATNSTYSFNAAATAYYVCTVTCSNGGGNATTAEVVVNVSNPSHSSILATPSTTCSPGSSVITATATGGFGTYTHTLTGPGTIGPAVVSGPNNSSVSFSVTGIPAGVNTYTLTSTDATGCSKVSTVAVTVNQTPVVTLTSVPPSTPASNYIVTTSAGNSIVPGTTLVPGSRGDDVTAPVTLPFAYNVYGTSFNSLIVSSNGNIQFSGTGNATFTNVCPIPSTVNLGAPFFMPQWDDLRTDVNAGDGIFTSVSGSAPNRIFNIEWRGSLFSIGGTINFEARLFEGQQRVDFIYGTNTNNGSSASIGVQGAATPTTLFTSFSCNTASLSSGLGVSFLLPSLDICNGTIVRLDATAIPTAPQTFTNLVNTHIPAGGTTTGIASPYPNPLAVSGLLTSGVSVKSVTINNYNHTFPDDVDLVLVSPTGQAVILMSDCGGGTDATGQNFTFDDAAAANLSDAAFNPSGTYKCTNFGAGDNWPAPGPGGTPSATTLSTFTGNMNGTWNLFAFDDVSGDIGLISTWSITFNVPQQVVFSPTTNLFTDAAATVPYTGTPTYTVWAKPSVNTFYTATSTIAGCTGSTSLHIIVNNAPAITTQPTAPAAPICPGFNTTFTVVATGTGLAYQWQRSTDNGTTWVNIVDDALHSGTQTPSVTVISPTVAQNGHRYRVVITGVCTPVVTSNSVTLVIATPPVITTQPVAVTTCVGLNPSFSVVATGVPAPNIYQWQVSTDAGVTWTNLTTGGSFTATFTITGVALAQNNNRYRVIVTNTCGQSVTSNAVLLTVNSPTTVAISPITSRICLTDTLVPLVATPAGGTWSGIGVSGFNFVPSATAIGTYTLTYTYVNASGCTSTGTTTVKVEDCPERLRELDENAVILFPNPNNGRFNIRINSDLYNYLGMKVYTTDGRLVKTQTFGGLVYGRVVPIDLSNLPAAAYMVKFFYDNGVRTNEKTFTVIVQRN